VRTEGYAIGLDMSMTDTTHHAAIIIAAYNAEATIARAVRSALAQPEAREVCVIDDASTDATVEAARACDDGSGRLLVIVQDANAGPSAARNRGIDATTAPWIGILDADDYILEGRLARMLAHAADADVIADNILRTPEGADASAAEPAAAWALADAGPIAIDFAAFVRSNLGDKQSQLDLGYSKPLIRRSFLKGHGLRYQPDMRLGEDYELYARALALGARFLITPDGGYISVEREGSLSRKHGAVDLRALRDCDDALARIRPLAPEERHALARHRTSVDCRLQWRLLIDAVKARDPFASLKTFRSPATAAYLAARLGEQAWLRSARALRGRR
jgi:succinoglycan biosynthesis protein ExoU